MEERNKDEFLQTDVEAPQGLAHRINHFVLHNRKMVSWVSIGAMLLVVIVYFGIDYMSKTKRENQEKAGTALSRVIPYYQAKDAQSIKSALYGDNTVTMRGEKIIGLVEIVQKYDGTPQGKLAALYAGNLFYLVKKYDESTKYFKIAADADSKLVLEGAYAGMGAVSEARGKYDEAITNYQKAVENYSSFASKNRYEYYIGLCNEQMGKKDDAIKIYKSIVGENKTADFVSRAKAGLTRLGTIIE
jgi:tetratricopeptide (TPR) repeat protein